MEQTEVKPMTNRAQALAAANAANRKKVNVTPSTSTPTESIGSMSEKDSANIDAELNFSKLTKSLEQADLSLEEFLEKKKGFGLSQSNREIKAPSGEIYSVVTSAMTYDEIKSQCFIDENNVRDSSERTEEALEDIIDEIGLGYQITPIMCYLNDKGLPIFDGSRRFESALYRKVGLTVDIFDRKPCQSDLLWLVESSGKAKSFSRYDKGRLFESLMDINSWTQNELSENKPYSKQEVSRCIRFFNAPTELISLFPSTRVSKKSIDTLLPMFSIAVQKGIISEVATRVQSELDDNESFNTLSLEDKLLFVSKQIITAVKDLSGYTPRKGTEPYFESGASKIIIKKSTGKKSNIELTVPKDIEEKILCAIKDMLS